MRCFSHFLLLIPYTSLLGMHIAGYEMVLGDLNQRRDPRPADLVLTFIAAVGKPALVGQVDRRGDLTLQRDPLPFVIQIRHRDRGEQRSGVGMDWIGKQLF